MIHEPKTEADREVYSAIVVLVNSRDSVGITVEQFVAICKKSPEYALRMIESNRTPLIGREDSVGFQISQIVMTAEWELKGTSEFIADHHFRADVEYIQFIENRLTTHPQDFSLTDLDTLLRHFPNRKLSIHQSALAELTKQVVAVASS